MKRVLTFGLTLLVAGIAVSLLAAAPTQRKFSPHQGPAGHWEPRRPRRSRPARLRRGHQGRHGLGLRPQRSPACLCAAGAPCRARPVLDLSGACARTGLFAATACSYYAILHDRRRASLGESPGERHDLGSRPRAAENRRSRHPPLRRDPGAGPGRRACQGRAVGWQIPPGPGPKAGPQSFLVGPDHSIWLHDSFNDRMLVWGDSNIEHDRALGASAGPDCGQRRGIKITGRCTSHTAWATGSTTTSS